MGWYPSVEDRSCVEFTRDGKEYEEIYCVYPWAKQFYFNWEHSEGSKWRPEYLYDFLHEQLWFPIAVVVFYLAAIYYGQKYFEKRQAWNLKGAMALWNLSLSVFSTFGFWRCLPFVVHNLKTYGFEGTLCNDPENSLGQSATGVWVVLFVLSKVPELFDTFFIVVHKKPLILLHWYHHASVLLCSWHTMVTHSPAGIIYTTVNYGVHSIMYFYYFLMAIKCKPKWYRPQWITIAQIAQMVVGCVISIAAFSLVHKEQCWAGFENNTGILVMYFSYFMLFSQFFLNRFGLGINVTNQDRSGKKKKMKAT